MATLLEARGNLTVTQICIFLWRRNIKLEVWKMFVVAVSFSLVQVVQVGSASAWTKTPLVAVQKTALGC